MDNKKRIILDVDTGIDDALAILFALRSKEAVIEGITTGFGNVSVEQATYNTLQVIQIANAGYDIPLAKGADKPLFREWQGPVTHIHGENGMGNVSLPQPVQPPLEETAADFIVRKAKELDGQLTVVCVGRLTNLALATTKDPELPLKIKEVVIMGGAVRVPGNVTPVSEANIWGDPEAAHIVFESGLPITMVGLDVTMKTVFTQEHLDQMKSMANESNREVIRFVDQMLQYRFDAYRNSAGLAGSPLHDPLAIGIALDSSLVEVEEMLIKIETKGKVSSGATVADLRAVQLDRTNASVCVGVKADRFLERFVSVIAEKGERQ
jgi:purine nucleosidase